MIFVHLLTSLLFIYLLATVPYLFILSLAGRFGRVNQYSVAPVKSRIAVIIPSYREDRVIVDTALQALRHDYPREKFSVTVIADQLSAETIQKLGGLPINLLPVQWERSMKAKSLHAALSRLASDNFDLALILDADNVMSPGCLEKVNHAWQNGWKAIQCHRTAKNRNNSVAILDAMSEEINNTLFRRGQRALGLSCALIGSGMAFEFGLIHGIFSLPGILDNPGEDKEVELQLLAKGMIVEYVENAYVFDEKVQRKEVFQKQRTRWLGTQFNNLKPLLSKEIRAHAPTRIYLHKLFEWLLLPRLLLVALLVFLLAVCVVDAFTRYHLLFPYWPWWIGLALTYAGTMLVAIPRSFYNSATLKALAKVPVLLFAMLRALLGMRKNKKDFLHTPKEFSG